MVALGVGIGLLGAFGLTRVLAKVLYETEASDRLTFGAVTLGLVAVALLACWLPARRATQVEPLVALRCE